jgi:hypothetical protein
MARSRTIQIFLKGSGVKIADFSNAVARVYVVPKDKINFIQSRPDLSTPALYMLFDDQRTSVYIGESENFKNRVINHLSKKHFWEWAVICIAKGEGLDKADIKFLESHAINKAAEIGRFDVKNKVSPNKNNLSEFKLESIIDLFEDFELLISTLGFNLFEPLREDNAGELEIEDSKKDKDIREFDTIIGPATGDGRIRAFENKNAWWAVRIAEDNTPKLKYVCLYEASPISAIRSYAKITKIEPYEDTPGKYIIHHDGNIVDLENPVVLGENPQLALYGPRYYKIEDIKKSKTMKELTNYTFNSNHR